MGFKETLHRNVDQTSWPGQIPVHYRYLYGLAGEKFFRGLKDEGKFYATVSPEASKVYCPPTLFCEETFEALTDWIELPPVGTVESFTLCYEDSDGAEQAPVAIAAIQLEGADTVFLHRVIGIDPEAVYIGMRVQAKFLPKKQRRGHLDDIAGFEPVA